MRRSKRYHPVPFFLVGLAGLACTLLVVRRLPGIGFFYMAVLVGCAVVLLYGALNFFMNRLGDTALRDVVNIVRHVMQGCTLLAVIGFGVIEFLIVSGQKSDAEPGADYVLVLGAGLRGETPSVVLTGRMEAALDYLRENPAAKAVLSGGQGEGESITEAEAMRRFFEAGGIAPERLILEDKSTSTSENVRFSKPLMAEGARVVVVSSEFHLFRARYIAEKNGIQAQVLAAPTPYLYLKVAYYVREFFSVVAMYLGRV